MPRPKKNPDSEPGYRHIDLPGQKTFEGFDDEFSFDLNAPDSLAEKYRKSGDVVDSPFTVHVDTKEQLDYTFENITGDSKNDYRRVNVRLKREKLAVGDYSIVEIPGVIIERKTQADLTSSLADTEKRVNLEKRFIKMCEGYQYAAIVVECNSSDFYTNPVVYTKLDKKVVYRTAISWAQRYPSVHWWFCANRDFAEQTTYRILENFYEKNSSQKDQRKIVTIIDTHLEAFRYGCLARKQFNEAIAAYPPKNPLDRSWRKGWEWYSDCYYGGSQGKILPYNSKQNYSANLSIKNEVKEEFVKLEEIAKTVFDPTLSGRKKAIQKKSSRRIKP